MKSNKLKILGLTILVASVLSSVNSYSNESIANNIKNTQENNSNIQLKIALLFGSILAVTGLSFAAILREEKEFESMSIDLSFENKGRKIK